MSLTSGTRNFWSLISNDLLWSGIMVGIIYYYLGWRGAVVGLMVALIQFVWMVGAIQGRVTRTMSGDWEGEPIKLEDLGHLDLSGLFRQSQDLESLGFVQLQDYQLNSGRSFARCLVHPQHHCFAEVGQIFRPDGKLLVVQTAISSALSEGWTLSMVNRGPLPTDSFTCLWRHPKRLVRLCPNHTMSELLQSHLSLRQQMVLDLGIMVQPDTSWDAYITQQKESALYRKRSVSKRNFLLGMIAVTRFELSPQFEWLGAYAQKAAQRAA